MDEVPPPTSCVCKSHYIEAKRYVTNTSYIPKWKGAKRATDGKKCSYPDCGDTGKLVVPLFEAHDIIKNYINTPNMSDDLLLCNRHYQMAYKEFSVLTPSPCAACNAVPKRDILYNRHCPNPTVINEHMNSTFGTSISLNKSDNICYSCYKLHNSILKYMERNEHSHDSALSHIIDNLDNKLSACTSEDKVTKAVAYTARFVAGSLLQNKALLLPSVSRLFIEQYYGADCTDVHSIRIEVGDGFVMYSSRWLLHQLIAELSFHLKYKCVHQRFGIILYRHEGNLLTSLSWALGSTLDANTAAYVPITGTCKSINEKEILNNAAVIVNDMLHEEIKKTACTKELQESDPRSLNIEQSIKEFNPLLWEFLVACTKSIRSRSHKETEKLKYAKRMRLYFLVNQLMYCTNIEQPSPIHNILADVVQMCGGSSVLLHFLNVLGCTTSYDTHNAFVTRQVARLRATSLWNEMSPHTFTVCSADNFDILQPHATVYYADQSRSYHGTTVQIVQPQPALTAGCTHTCADNVCTMTQLSSPELQHGRQHSTSPCSSPHQLGKDGPKRIRSTSPALPTIATPLAIPIFDSDPPASSPLPPELIPAPVHVHDTTPSVDDFLINTEEVMKAEKLHKNLFTFIITKQANNQQPTPCEKVVTNIKAFMQCVHPMESIAQSKFYYLSLFDENSDSEETMLHISEEVLQLANSECQNGYVVLVGDGKTFQYLTKIKKKYGQALHKLIIYPGDWHLLKNFQEVLMKQYFHSGLQEIALASGFKASTLRALQACSHFKRTHIFLLNVWEAMYQQMVQSSSILDSTLQSMLDVSCTESILTNTDCYIRFHEYVRKQGEVDMTFKYWSDFVLVDCCAYIQLYLAIRSGNWSLRVAAIKKMAPLFTVFDQDIYMKLIPSHLLDISQHYPKEILACFMSGGFTVSLTGEPWNNVALDEAHEMKINKDLKLAVIRPTPEY